MTDLQTGRQDKIERDFVLIHIIKTLRLCNDFKLLTYCTGQKYKMRAI